MFRNGTHLPLGSWFNSPHAGSPGRMWWLTYQVWWWWLSGCQNLCQIFRGRWRTLNTETCFQYKPWKTLLNVSNGPSILETKSLESRSAVPLWLHQSLSFERLRKTLLEGPTLNQIFASYSVIFLESWSRLSKQKPIMGTKTFSYIDKKHSSSNIMAHSVFFLLQDFVLRSSIRVPFAKCHRATDGLSTGVFF